VAEKATNVVHVWLADEDLGVFDFQKFSNSDGYLVENTSGLTVKAFFEGIGEMRAIALQTFVWLLRRRKGQDVARASIDFAIGDLRLETVEDPTVASDGTNETVTSDSSPTSAI